MMPRGFTSLSFIATCKPGHHIMESNRITEIGGERIMKYGSLVVNEGGSGPKVPKEGLDPDLTKMTGPHSRGT